MKFKKLFNKSNRRKPRANAFVLESLEPRLLLSATPMTAAVVTTDHLDYAPGETAVITTANTNGDGLQFGAGELVRFDVSRTDGMADAAGTTAGVGPMGNEAWYVTDGVGGFTARQEFDANGQAVDRDANGVADWIAPDNDNTINSSISTTWFVEEQYRNSSLLVTAVGQESGAVANQAFTDAGMNTTTVLTATSATTVYGTRLDFTATVTAAAGTVDPTGSVEFFVDGISLGIESVSSGGAADGVVEFKTNLFSFALTAGIHSVHAVFTGTVDGFSDSTSVNISHEVTQKHITGRFIADLSKVYDGTTVAPGTPTLNNVELIDLISVSLAGAANFDTANVGTKKTVTFTITGNGLTGSAAGNYILDSVRNDVADITPATVTVSDYTGVYDGLAHGAVALDPFGNPLGGLSTVTHTDVGTYTEGWTFSNANYVAATGTNTITITKANATIVTSGHNGVYDGAAHTATATATGVLGESLSGLVLNATPHSNAGTYSDSWTFTDSTGNYNSTSGSVISTIAKANATIDVQGYSGTYNAAAHGATLGGVTGVAGDLTAIGSVLTLGGETFTDAPGGTATWSFIGGTNYNDQNGSVAIVIAQATVTITGAGLNGSGYFGTYNGQAHAATATVTGVGGANLGQLVSSTTATNAGVVSHTVTFAGDTNYKAASKILKTYILQASVTLTGAGLNGSGYFGTYDGQAHAATATVTGVAGANLGPVVSSTTHTDAGTYSDTVTFLGDVNYKAASKTVTSYILKASVTLTGAGLNGSGYFGTYDGQAHFATATVTGVGGVSVGQVVSGTTHTNAGTYSDTVTFLGDANHKAASKVLKSYILKATAVITVTGYNVVFDGAAHTATGTATGVNGEDLSAGLNLSLTTHTNVGVYLNETVTFTGGTNYKDAVKLVSDRIRVI